MATSRYRRFLPNLEALENRVVPVLGLTGPGPVAPLGSNHGDYDGVVRILGGGDGSGSILTNSAYILTAAHVVAGKAGVTKVLHKTSVEFDYDRGGGQSGKIEFKVPGNNDFNSVHPNWNHLDPAERDDIALLALPDQTQMSGAAPTPSAGRVMVAPFRQSDWGPNRYGIYETFIPTDVGNKLSAPLPYSIAGYGEIGESGSVGRNSDRVDRIKVSEPQDTSAFEFTIDISGPGGTVISTARIPQGATAQQVANALDLVDGPGVFAVYKNYSVNTKSLGAGTYDIRSIGDRGYGKDSGGILGITRYDTGANEGVTALAVNQFVGRQSYGTLRIGTNEFDGFTATSKILLSDFDNGAANTSSYGSLGIAGSDSFVGRGDSGGPALYRMGGVPQIVGVASYIGNPPGAQDRTEYRLPDGKNKPDSSTGEVSGHTYVKPYVATFLKDILEQHVDLVLDMNYQTFGLTDNPGGPGSPENLTITAKRNSDNLEIWVTQQQLQDEEVASPELEGMYYSAPIANIKSLTLRGSNDNEVFVIDKSLYEIDGGLRNGEIKIEGRGGNDRLAIDGSTSNEATTFNLARGFAGSGYDSRLTVADKRFFVDSKGVESLQINTGSKIDNVNLNAVSSALQQGVQILNYGGEDIVKIFKPSVDMNARVYVDGSMAPIKLEVDDGGTAGVGNLYVLGKPEAGLEAWKFQISEVVNNLDRPSIIGRGVTNIQVTTTAQKDIVRVDAVDSTITSGVAFSTGVGNDEVTVGTDTSGLNFIEAHVGFDGGGDAGDELIAKNKNGEVPAVDTGVENDGFAHIKRENRSPVHYRNFKKPKIVMADDGLLNFYGVLPGVQHTVAYDGGSKNLVRLYNDLPFDPTFVGATEVSLMDGKVTTSGTFNFAVPSGTMLTGAGTVTTPLVENISLFSPGDETDPVGIFTFQGNYTQTTGTLAIELGGAGGSDLIAVSDSTAAVALGGSLQLGYLADFSPSLGATYTILDNRNTVYGTTGAFAGLPQNFEFPIPIPGSPGLGFKISYSAGSNANDVVLTVVKLPFAVNDTFTIHQSAPLTTLGSVLANDIAGTVALKGYLETGASQGTTFTFARFGASVRYKPRAGTIGSGGAITNGFTGTDTFTYTLKQGTYTSPAATGTITVQNTAPTVVQRDQYFATSKNVSFHVDKATLLGGVNAADADSDAMGPATASMTHTNVSFATREGGRVWLNWTTGFSYNPPPRPSPGAPLFEGWDSFEYRVWDKAGFSEIVTVHVAVGGVPPIVMASKFGAITVDGFSLGNVLDHDASSNESVSIAGVSLLAGPQHGTLTLNADDSTNTSRTKAGAAWIPSLSA